LDARFFRSSAELRRWLAAHHGDAGELWIGFYKKGSTKKGVSYREALDEALCFGWIDGLTRRIDDSSYMIRFSPRKPNSNWSAINIDRVNELIGLGRMRPPGLEAFERRDEGRSRVDSYERTMAKLDSSLEKVLRSNRKAWEFFQAQPPSYRRVATWWVVSATREETRRRRLTTLIAHSVDGVRIPQVASESPRPAATERKPKQ
jgi:uncharacterized protein YdeI (YjbR/CyaY-like superfamily)